MWISSAHCCLLLVANVRFTSTSVFFLLVIRWAFEFDFRYVTWDSEHFLPHVVSLGILRIPTAPCLVIAVWAFELRWRTVVLAPGWHHSAFVVTLRSHCQS